jgi:hypothetical protein
MKISHEVPLSLLEKSLTFNDYQYVLPHLLDKYDEYKTFMLKYRDQENSFIIMDNGLFEGVSHTEEDLIEKINLIKPDIFITPDDWNNANFTYRNAKYWMNTVSPQLPPETKLMVVLQGKTLEEMTNLYDKCIDLEFKHFAFNHSSNLYQRMFNHPNKLVNQMMGRIELIHLMKKQGYINDNHYIHLLGASLPQEFLFYQWSEYKMLKSVDTSSPIINGALGITYNDYGLFSKPSCKIEEFFEDDLEEQIGNITFNINKFREYVK